jgi:hypothetical protein
MLKELTNKNSNNYINLSRNNIEDVLKICEQLKKSLRE